MKSFPRHVVSLANMKFLPLSCRAKSRHLNAPTGKGGRRPPPQKKRSSNAAFQEHGVRQVMPFLNYSNFGAVFHAACKALTG